MLRSREKRTAKRANYICEIQCDGYGIKQLSTRINDISTTGLFIDSISCLGVGSILSMKFSVLGVPIEVTGEVRHSLPQSGMGIQFIDLKPEHREVIECLVEGKPLSSLHSTLTAQSSMDAETIMDDNSNAEGQKILMGNFAIISLFDVIQMIENSRVTGVLIVDTPAVKGEVYFNDGQIANAKVGADFGVNAFVKFLGVMQGLFEFRKTDREYIRTIQATSNTGLLLDLLAAKDEEAAYS